MSRIVSINVYNLDFKKMNNNCLGMFGIGLYHTGVVIDNTEYAFGMSEDENEHNGIYSIEPGTFNNNWKCNLLVGEIYLNNFEIDCILSTFRHEYYAHEYDLIYNNCNHFTKRLCKELCNYTLPSWVNRAARIGRRLNFCCSKKRKKQDYITLNHK
tara:strand:+ start:173 stop:640 length:468 start_codon:yes stop_codon:yes gene_type:complete